MCYFGDIDKAKPPIILMKKAALTAHQLTGGKPRLAVGFMTSIIPEKVGDPLFLDLYSIRPTKIGALPMSLEVSCSYSAPYFAFEKAPKTYGLVQGCCNHWDCPRCGQQRARYEYGRIVVGTQKIAETHPIFFLTLTCRGKEVSAADADLHYYEWTNRFLDAARVKARREKKDWIYAQVTERQKRGHPHSHVLTTFDPGDLLPGFRDNWKTVGGVLVNQPKPCLRSEWIAAQCIRSGLGDQYDISRAKTPAGVSRYVAKYMFKDSMFGATWPEHWRRVRYSQSFPKLPDRESNAFVLLSNADWDKLAGLAIFVTTEDEQVKREALYRLAGHDIFVS